MLKLRYSELEEPCYIVHDSGVITVYYRFEKEDGSQCIAYRESYDRGITYGDAMVINLVEIAQSTREDQP